MQFLRTLFWVVLAVVLVIFGYNNWVVVTVRLWTDLVLDTPLPILLLGAFLLGLVPALILHRATRWNLRRKLEAVSRLNAPPPLTPTTAVVPVVPVVPVVGAPLTPAPPSL